MPYYDKNTVKRINRFCERLHERYDEVLSELECTAYVTHEPVPYADRMTGEKKCLAVGDTWGDLFDCAWINMKGAVPDGYPVDKLVLLVDISGEGLYYDEERGPVIGITTGSVAWESGSMRKRVIPLPLCNVKDGKIDIWIDAASNGLFGDYVGTGSLKEAHIALEKSKLRALYYDFFVLKEAMENLSVESPRYHSIKCALNDAVNAVTDFTEDEATVARAILSKELGKKGGDPSFILNAIGHSHIDLAWLWPIRETVRKGARTFATVERMMERFPDYLYGSSQPQLLAWMKEYYPTLYESIKKRVKEGRFECQGGMWVEADTNLAGGEALVRQILYGTRFWKDEFGVDVDNVWLPDVFGYTAALPQIMKKSDIPYFMTQKLSWNEHNPFPHHTFNWYGLDGSHVLAHMLPEETYNSPASPASIRISERNFREKGVSDQALMLFGIGDGGGGPGTYHLEKLDRLKNLEGFSPVRQRFARDFFKDIDVDSDRYAQWHGELYFEFHRGTYTTQARNKWYNRKLEQGLRELEYASVLAWKYSCKAYPKENLERIWKEVLLYQFHDILPGSSIKRVYDECVPRYEKLYQEVQHLIQQAYESITSGTTAYNSLAFSRCEYIKHDGNWMKATLPSMGSTTLEDIEDKHLVTVTDSILENDKLRVKFNDDGSISSIYDKMESREVLTDLANQFKVYDDSYGNAWDIEITYDQPIPKQFTLTSSKHYLDGPTAVVEQVFSFGKSTLTQYVKLHDDDNMLRFDTVVDWHESEKMMRTAFPVSVYTDEVTCDIQFGSIKRPTHRNTTWDMTRFEICAHKWIDLSRDDYGVALINDCKYGHKVLGNVMDLNLLRSSISPDIAADQGEHRFSYALYPHRGTEKIAQVERKALAFNIKPVVVSGNNEIDKPTSFVDICEANVELVGIKKAEDSDSIIIRMNETDGVAVSTTIKLPAFTQKAHLCNLMERKEHELDIKNSSVVLDIKPYELITIAIE